MRTSLVTRSAAIAATLGLLAPSWAAAHVGIPSGPLVANATQEITFGVGHGCEGSDTYTIKIDIPAGVTSVRAVPNSFGKVSVQKDAQQNVVSVTWQKADADLIAADENYYLLSIRAKAPNTPFATIYFPTHQTCKNPATGATTSTEWVSTMQTDAHDAGAAGEPAPATVILPAKKPGWNKFVVPQALASLSPYFDDAQIVWKGSAAHSANPATLDQIKTTAGVTQLTALAAGDEIWVKY
jgi:uncharacterized protein YcnI